MLPRAEHNQHLGSRHFAAAALARGRGGGGSLVDAGEKNVGGLGHPGHGWGSEAATGSGGPPDPRRLPLQTQPKPETLRLAGSQTRTRGPTEYLDQTGYQPCRALSQRGSSFLWCSFPDSAYGKGRPSARRPLPCLGAACVGPALTSPARRPVGCAARAWHRPCDRGPHVRRLLPLRLGCVPTDAPKRRMPPPHRRSPDGCAGSASGPDLPQLLAGAHTSFFAHTEDNFWGFAP
eukprot:scaffold3_cov389-Prasinococcus_capsulatus_cf.AAC.22